jgi:hypothetical protein
LNPEDQLGVKLDLPYNLCDFINYLQIPYEHKGDKVAQEHFISAIKRAAALIENPIKETNRITAAMEWHFDSLVEKDLTMKFIKVCIGLESLLGEDKSDGSLTKTLADRCAYLNAKCITDRATIRDTFKNLYEARSSLIHGVNRQLKNDEIELLDWGDRSLQIAILNESKLLG